MHKAGLFPLSLFQDAHSSYSPRTINRDISSGGSTVVQCLKIILHSTIKNKLIYVDVRTCYNNPARSFEKYFYTMCL